MASALDSISSACSDSIPGLVSMETLTVPVSSDVISSVSIPLASTMVAMMMATDDSMTMALCLNRTGMMRRYAFCRWTTGRDMGAFTVSFGLYII